MIIRCPLLLTYFRFHNRMFFIKCVVGGQKRHEELMLHQLPSNRARKRIESVPGYIIYADNL